jgi:EAL domain-containing protein (putative c-di-GMP-specific phosphodiesterase class I)
MQPAIPIPAAEPAAESAAARLAVLAPTAEALALATVAKPRSQRRGPRPGSRNRERRRMQAELARAMATGGLALHFQVRVDLRSGRPLGAEALARWPHPALGNIPPTEFIPVAEECGLILDLGAWALEAACIDAARWPNNRGIVAVNVSSRQIEAGVLGSQVQKALAVSGLDPKRLELELTEGTLLDTSASALAALAELRATGVRLALDDFGTGFASLAAVRKLPLTTLKIDRSFVSGLPEEPEDVAIIRAVADIGRALRLQLVAEGVETAAQRTALISLGITEGQGWLYGRPVPSAALRRHFG